MVPTRQVVGGFGAISRDNRLVLTMEWVAEALAMWLVAALVAAVVVGADEAAARLAYRVCAAFLVVLAAWTAMTGARTPVIWFKLCPGVLTLGAGLLVTAFLVS